MAYRQSSVAHRFAVFSGGRWAALGGRWPKSSSYGAGESDQLARPGEGPCVTPGLGWVGYYPTSDMDALQGDGAPRVSVRRVSIRRVSIRRRRLLNPRLLNPRLLNPRKVKPRASASRLRPVTTERKVSNGLLYFTLQLPDL
jgi:hypothetical protein